MTVESLRGENENCDSFPIGLRVLAVDDDPICLKVLETLLKKCKYTVTTTTKAGEAYSMLRKDKDRFDLVISDVHMPDMDGFKLLELVGLEMDLPVIMLSAYGDPKLVMKGVTHGACDYLLKPVRIEELRNIWQHVIRRKKIEPKKHSKSDQVNAHQGSGEVQGSLVKSNADQNGRVTRKRKDDEEDSEDDDNESEDPGAQKRPRVVWSIDLHRKFVAAVNQLGIEKAVPKRILDLMNVEGLTRENVASHLQKYRLYLRRISSVTNQHVNMTAALGIKDASFMRSYDSFGDFQTLSGTGRLGNVALLPYTASGMLSRLNSPSNVNLRNLNPSSIIQTGPTQNLNISINSLGKVHPILSGQTPSLFQGIPSSLELDQLQSKSTMGISGFDESRIFSTTSAYPDRISGSSNLLNNALNNGHQTLGQLSNPASFEQEPFNSVTSSANLLDPVSLDTHKVRSNSLMCFETFQSRLPLNNVRDDSCLNAFSLPNLASLPLDDAIDGLISDNQRWGENRQNYGQISNINNTLDSLNSHSHVSRILSPSNRNWDQSNGILNQKMAHTLSVNGRTGGGASPPIQQNDVVAKSGTAPRARFNENFILEQPEMHGGFVPQSHDSLDILMNTMIKRAQNGGIVPSSDFGFDAYAFGTSL